jgi:glycosyltransferase involved in cell wall biosynthesis
MRILYSFPHALGAPGIGTTAVRQVLGMLARGHEVEVFAASVHRDCPSLGRPVRCTMVFSGLRIPHKILGMDRTMAFHDRRVAAHLKQRAGAFDVVHCWPGAALDTARAGSQVGIAVLREVPNTHTANAYAIVAEVCRDLDIELPRGHSHRMNAERLRHEEAEYAACHRLLVPSDHVAETFRQRGYPPEKLLRHQYGFDPVAFVPGREHKKQPFHMVFLGAVEPRKGLHVALEAWRRSGAFERARFSIYGRVVEEYRPTIERYLHMPNVDLFEFTNDPAGVLRSSDALILPSFEEGSALVTYEAQGCGAVPVVSEAAGALCEHRVSGMIHPVGDVDLLCEHIHELITDRALLHRLREGVLAQRDRLTWTAAAERLEQCYEAARSGLSLAET